jgi:ankyrin repeat protein
MAYHNIHYYIEKNDLEGVKIFVDNNKNLNIEEWGRLILNTACFYGNYDSIFIMIQSGSDVNGRNYMGHDAMYTSCFKNNALNIFQLLKDHGAILDRKYNKLNNTLLHIACQYCDIEIIKFLIYNGLDSNVQNLSGHIPIQISLMYGRDELVCFLWKYVTDISELELPYNDIYNIKKIVCDQNWKNRRIIMMERFSECLDCTSSKNRTIHGSVDIFKHILSYI